ncbi:MAG: efflux RND transporter permease subunit [Spirochaetaceae bacterium]|nr:MAG: efflux RND transporter permease subunit [Spirochaetaceae bacterium]
MLRLIFRKELGVLLLFTILGAAGIVLVSRMAVQLYPRTSRPAVTSTIQHQGYSAIAFSREYGEMIESRLMGVPGLARLEMRYGSNQSRFTITFDWEVDAEVALADAESALNQIENSLPGELGGVSRVRFSTGENAGFLIIGVSSPTVSAEDLHRMATGSLEARMSQVKDVEMVEILSVERLNVEILLRQHDMLRYGLTISDINSAMQQSRSVQSIGSLREGRSRMSVHALPTAPDLLNIGRTVVRRANGVAIYLEDVADIEIAYTIPQSTFVMEGSRGIQIVATPIDGGNIRSMSQEITRLVREARDVGDLPDDAEINLLLDPAAYINRAITNVVQAALIGAVLAMVVVFLALGKVRNTMLIGISLPVTMVLTFIFLYLSDISLNLISLGGMALAVGMVVDSSIVVIENIHRFRTEEGHTADREHLQDLIMRAVRQVRMPIIASTLTSVLVFLPISFTAPLTNAILGEQSMVVVFALLLSLAVALTLVPLVAYLMYRRHIPEDRNPTMLAYTRNISTRAVAWLEGGYMALLRRLVASRSRVIMLLMFSTILLVTVVATLLPRIPREVLSPPSSDRVIVFLRSTGDVTSEEIVEEKFPEMTAIVQEELGPYVARIYGEVRGRFNRLFVALHSPRDADYVTGRLQEIFVSDNDWYYNVISWDPAQLPLPRTSDLQISVDGPDETGIVALLERVRDLTGESELYAWVTTVPSTSYTDELILHPREDVIEGTSGYTRSQLVSILQRALSGTQAVEFEHEGLTVNARATYPDELLEGRARFENFLLPWRDSALPVKHFFDFSVASNVAEIASEDGEPVYRLYGNMSRGTPTTERVLAEERIRELLAERLEIPEGYGISFDNPQVELDQAIRSLFISLALSVALIYLLLTFQFNSFGAPLVILVSVPLGFFGLVLSLYLFNSTLSLNSLLGAILLSGVVVNNSIILVDFYLSMLREFPSRTEALLAAARVRFRPIVITTLTTIAGMLPIAIGIGEGAAVIRPLGIAVSGGLAVSTLMTLFIVPAVLSLVRLRSPATSRP